MGQRGFWDEERRTQKLQDKSQYLFYFLLRFHEIPFYLCLIVAAAKGERRMQGESGLIH